MAKRTVTEAEKLAAIKARIERDGANYVGWSFTVYAHDTTEDHGVPRTFIVGTGNSATQGDGT